MDESTGRLAEIDRAFDKGLDLDPGKRRAWLSGLAEKDPELARAVAELLELAEREDTRLAPECVLDGPLWRELSRELLTTTAPTLVGDAPPAEAVLPGDRFGSYRVLHEIGRGGMSVVYLAERADLAFEHRVALKVLHRGSADAVRRLEQERQILANLSHPAIARLLDGGVDAKGRPFIVMEYVEGQPIDRYCDDRRLLVGERMELFIVVARAVGHAHRNLVVHRDLKPSNIFVSDGGEVKLLDFGIAKLLDTELAGAFAVPATRTLMRVLTPEYASPEQIRGEAVTTASDVYQLGLLLFELLTGERAYRVTGSSVAELERSISSQEPRRPSAALAAQPEPRRAAAARARRVTPAALVRQLAGDLDNIVLTALRKEPERRYASVEHLAEDVRRHRDGLPVAARRDTVGYRLRKFVGRHRFGVAAAAAFTLVLVAYAVSVTVLLGSVARERDRVREVKDFLVSVFEVSDPEQSKGEEVTARQLLDRGAERIEEELAEAPSVQAELMATVGEIYRKLALLDRAEAQLRRSLELAKSVHGDEDPAVADVLVELALVLRKLDKNEEALRALEEALTIRRKRLGDEHPAVASVLDEMAVAYRMQGEYDRSEELGGQALAIRRNRLGDEHPDVASSLNNLGLVLRWKGDLDGAEELLREALAIRRRVLDENHIDLLTSLTNLGLVLRQKSEYAEAAELFRTALEKRRKLLGDAHPDIAVEMNHLAMALRSLGELEEAETLLRDALEIRRTALGEEHPRVAANWNDLGWVLYDQGDYEGAESCFRQALAIYGPEHRWRSASEFNLAIVLQAKGLYGEAEALIRQILDQDRERLGDAHPTVAVRVYQLGSVLQDQGKLEEAEPLLRQALGVFRGAYEPGHPWIAKALVALGRLLVDRGRPEEALPLLTEALDVQERRHGEEHLETARAKLALGACLTSLGRYDEAEELLVAGDRQLVRSVHGEGAESERALVALYEAWGKEEEARRYRERRAPAFR